MVDLDISDIIVSYINKQSHRTFLLILKYLEKIKYSINIIDHIQSLLDIPV